MNNITEPLRTASIEEIEKQKREVEYFAYKRAGGFLSISEYETTLRYLHQVTMDDQNLKEEISRASPATKSRFKTECRKIGTSGTPVQQFLYCCLRMYNKATADKFGYVKPIETVGGKSDQEICATTFLLTGDVESSVKYMAFFPNIFKFIKKFGDSQDEIILGLRQVVSTYDSLRQNNTGSANGNLLPEIGSNK